MTTITDYLNDLKVAVKNIIQDPDTDTDEKMLDVDDAILETEQAITDLLGRII